MSNMMAALVLIVGVSIFYSAGINIMVYWGMPLELREQAYVFGDSGGGISLEDTTGMLQNSLKRQTRIPLIEVGALVFYSGNIIIDLVLNFAFAVPEMFTLVLNGAGSIFNLPSELMVLLGVTSMALYLCMYVLAIIQMIANIRSSGRVV